MSTIVESALIAATNTDILQATRLQTLMGGGVLTIEVSASATAAANNMVMSLQLPNGKTPLNGVLIPVGSAAGSLDDRTSLKFRVAIGQGGGHPVFSMVLTGTSIVIFRATYQDNR